MIAENAVTIARDNYLAVPGHAVSRAGAGGGTTCAGVDGCPGGWLFVALDRQDGFEVGIRRHFAAVADALRAADLVLVDMPIGLPSAAVPLRETETAARRILAARGSTVFPVPARPALAAPGYEAACELNRRVTGRRLSRQSWHLCAKIRELDDYLAAHPAGSRIREMHPELVFWALNDRRVLTTRKKSAAGRAERIAVLRRHFGAVDALLAAARAMRQRAAEAGDDDILDALAGAVTARLWPRLETVPLAPGRDERGLPMEMVHAAGGGPR